MGGTRWALDDEHKGEGTYMLISEPLPADKKKADEALAARMKK